MEIKQAWYRISVKALIYNDKWEVLLAKELNWVWDFPGGWLDHGENPITCLKRELMEEMWLKIKYIEEKPEHFLTAHKPNSKSRPWIANVFYKVVPENLDFKKSDECVEIWFFDKDSVKDIEVIENVREFFN